MVEFKVPEQKDIEEIMKDASFNKLMDIYSIKNQIILVIKDNNRIIGGVSGFYEDIYAFATTLIVKTNDDNNKIILTDGLLRTLVNLLENKGIEKLFINNVYIPDRIPSYPLIHNENSTIHGKILNFKLDSVIDVKNFFSSQKCC